MLFAESNDLFIVDSSICKITFFTCYFRKIRIIKSKIWKNRLDVTILNSSKMLFVDANVSLIADSSICKLNSYMFYLNKILILLCVCTIGHTF